MTGRPNIDTRAIWTEVQLNRRKRQDCTGHRFPPRAEHKFGERVTCTACGAWMSVGDALSYCEGFAAAGGDVEAVWPGLGASTGAAA